MGMATYKYPDLVNRNKKLIKENADLREQLEEKNTQLAKLMGSAAGSYLALQEQRDEARNEARKYYRLYQEERASYELLALVESGATEMMDTIGIKLDNTKAELKEAQERIVELADRLSSAHKVVSKIAGYAPLSLAKRIAQQLQKKVKP